MNRKSFIKAAFLAAALGLQASAPATAQPAASWDQGELTQRVQGCTQDGRKATLIFKYDADIDFLIEGKAEGYQRLVEEARAYTQGTLSAEWSKIVSAFDSGEMREGRASPEGLMLPLIDGFVARYGDNDKGERNVWPVLIGGGLQSGRGFCATPG